MGIIRFSLALIVLVSHAGSSLFSIGALAAVQAFFMLSGMYMAAVYTSRYGLIPDGAREFYLNRALRLYPTYFILIILTAIIYFTTQDIARPEHNHLFDLFEQADAIPLTALAMIWSSIVTLLGQDFLSVHEPYHFMLPVRQGWSIASELLFYVMVPLLFKHMTIKRCLAGFALLMAIKFILLKGYGWRASYFLPIGNFGYFLLGYGAYLISGTAHIESIKLRYGEYLKTGILLIMLLMLALFGEASFERGGLLRHFIMLAIFTTGCVLLFERAVSKFDIWLGNIAYGIYLNHFLLIVVLKQMFGGGRPRKQNLWFISSH